jgi:hypothetical protein
VFLRVLCFLIYLLSSRAIYPRIAFAHFSFAVSVLSFSVTSVLYLFRSNDTHGLFDIVARK